MFRPFLCNRRAFREFSRLCLSCRSSFWCYALYLMLKFRTKKCSTCPVGLGRIWIRLLWASILSLWLGYKVWRGESRSRSPSDWIVKLLIHPRQLLNYFEVGFLSSWEEALARIHWWLLFPHHSTLGTSTVVAALLWEWGLPKLSTRQGNGFQSFCCFVVGRSYGTRQGVWPLDLSSS